MEYNKIKEMLTDYVQGLLSEEDSLAVKGELEKSEALRKEYEELRSYYNALMTLKPVKAPHNFLDKVHSRIEEHAPLAQFFRKLFYPFHIKVPIELAGLALTAVLIILIYNPFTSKKIPPVDFDELTMKSKAPAIDTIKVKEAKESEKSVAVEKDVAELKEKAKEKELPPVSTTQKAGKVSEPTEIPATKPAKKDISPTTPEEAGEIPKKSVGLLRKEKVKEKEADISHLEEAAPEIVETERSADQEEIYAKKLIDRSDSIVLNTKQAKPEPVDIGLLALSITKKEKKAPKAKVSLEQEKRSLSAQEEAPVPYIDVIAESENDIIFAQVQSTIKQNKGKFTLLKDKTQKLDKRYYMIEISLKEFPALRKALEQHGVVIEENISFKEEESERIKFNLVVSIK